ncbi:ABC transporter substrate-binding protein [Leptolyngbya sp. CCNP1308]|uniref:ABC transporter substrate-binding protein n=1 Tax=Leptolyngbya sp. CCNP1308 TaxID=3110255 RepID=UPI002B209687|nr:ABC transporter substrate-binding protein [Leptolyngbya sp. CCNP1308]MEA5449891.1 ABC transporter substrate-binding protein [Leptolyngbya sp. CCNP1308]
MTVSRSADAFAVALNRRRFLRYSSLALGAGVLAACGGSPSATAPADSAAAPGEGELDKVTFGTSWFAQAEHGGFYQAVATGIYNEHGLDVTISMGGPQVNGNQLLMAGAQDFKMGYAIDAINSIQEGVPKVTVAAIFQKDPQGLMAHPDVGIESFEDLKGKTILMSTSAHTTYWPFIKAKYGLSDDQMGVYTFNVGPFVADKNLVQQGYITSEPFAIEKEGGFEPVVLLMADHGYPNYTTTIETRREIMESNPDLVQRFVDASIKGWYSYLADPAPGNELIKQDNPEMSDEQLAFGLEKLNEYGIINSGDAETQGIGAMTAERWQEIFTTMADLGAFDASVDYKQAYSLDFVNKGADAYQS